MSTETKPAGTSTRKSKDVFKVLKEVVRPAAVLGAVGIFGGVFLSAATYSDRMARGINASELLRPSFRQLEEATVAFCGFEREYKGASLLAQVDEAQAAIYYSKTEDPSDDNYVSPYRKRASLLKRGLWTALNIYNHEADKYNDYADVVVDHGVLGTGFLGIVLDADIPYAAPSLAEMRKLVCDIPQNTKAEIDEIIGPTS